MKWFKDGLNSLKEMNWLRREYLLIIVLGIFLHASGYRASEISSHGWAYNLLMGDLWLPPIVLYIIIRINSVNKEIFANRNARRALLLLFLIVELICILVLVTDSRFPETITWLSAVLRGETSWYS